MRSYNGLYYRVTMIVNKISVIVICVAISLSSQAGSECDRCIPVEQCQLVYRMSQAEKSRFMSANLCQIRLGPRLTGIAQGDRVCCSVITPHTYSQNTIVSSSYQQNQAPYQGQRFNNEFNGPQFGVNTEGVQNRNPSGFQLNRNQNFNHYNTRSLSNGQCELISNFPPTPNSGCCGREVSGVDRTTGTTPTMSISTSSTTPVKTPALAQFSSTTRILTSTTPINWLNYFMGRTTSAPRTIRSNSNITVDNRITGGKVTEIDQFPWTVLIQAKFRYKQEIQTFNCGGSLISSKFVITASHCVYEDGSPLQGVEIYLAEYDKRTFPTDCVNSYGEWRCIQNIIMQAEDVILHPQFDDESLQNDIALIKLQGNSPYNDFIRPICLPTIDVDSTDLKNLPLTVAGWGRDGPYVSNTKQYTVVNLVPQKECQKYYGYLTRRHLCAAGNSGEDTCKGDSGGPLMMFYKGKYYIAGIVSGKRKDSPCGSAVPSLYTNVYHYLDWIRSVIRN